MPFSTEHPCGCCGKTKWEMKKWQWSYTGIVPKLIKYNFKLEQERDSWGDNKWWDSLKCIPTIG